MIAIDKTIFVDREPGALNQVATEKLCRKALAVVSRWKDVARKID